MTSFTAHNFPNIAFEILARIGKWAITKLSIGNPDAGSTLNSTKPKFYGNHLEWDIDREAKPFRVFVVEPDVYAPQYHKTVFDAALTALTAQPVERTDPFERTTASIPSEPFDLVTFPEAFLPAGHLVSILKGIGDVPGLGCVHSGLRPSDAEDDQHLFKVKEIRNLVADLTALSETIASDLAAFRVWLDVQHPAHLFNLGCLFVVDAHRALRVCLHPKLVRSKFETSGLPERNMAEGNLLTLVTLYPTNKIFKTITLQPLICSDALELPTDRGTGFPLEAVTKDARCVSARPPDHIDIVSVASCTPQSQRTSSKGHAYIAWHDEFKNTFERAALRENLSRHHYATFVLSNFRTLPSSAETEARSDTRNGCGIA